MTVENHTIQLLTEMRKDIAETRDEMRKDIAETREEMRAGFGQAGEERATIRERMVEGEIRTATELLAVSGSLDEIKALIRQQAALKMVVHDHERRIRKLETE